MFIQSPTHARRRRLWLADFARVPIAWIAASILSATTSSAAIANDWPRWRGTGFNGISTETGWSVSWPQEGPKQLWKSSVGTGFSSVAIAGGRLYTLGNQGGMETVYCLDANNGKELWKHSYACPLDPNLYEGGPNATPTVDGNVVYTFSRKGNVFGLDAGTGKLIWSKNVRDELGAKIPDWGFSGSPLGEGALLVLNAGPAGTALDKVSGKVAWSSGRESAGYSSPVPFTQGSVRGVLLFSTKTLSAVNPETGLILWQHPWPTAYGVNAADPVVIGDRIFVSSGYNQGCALLKMTGRSVSVLWQNKNMRNHFNSSVALGESIYGFDESELKCLDLQTGNVRWSERSLGKGSLAAADGKLILLGEKGELVMAEASATSFKALARAQVLGGKCWTSPVMANGKIYCRNARGDLVCLDVGGHQTARQ
jgi:outer membrane protein assembly factor BamB